MLEFYYSSNKAGKADLGGSDGGQWPQIQEREQKQKYLDNLLSDSGPLSLEIKDILLN